MTQERWDVVLRFLSGPLAAQAEVVCRGPVVRLGAAPGPGGLALRGTRGIDDRQAVITAYDGSRVTLAPVGSNQVRLAPHENVDWREVPPIRRPEPLTRGAAFHLGPPDRGVTVVFVESRRLGSWEQGGIVSDASQLGEDGIDRVEELDASRGVPRWFIVATLTTGLATAVAVTIPLIGLLTPDPGTLGPIDEGREYYEFVDASVEVDPELLEGLNQPFHDFVMKPNADAARWPALASSKGEWDGVFLDYVTRSARLHAQGWSFWRRLDAIVDDYAYVVGELRKAGLPEVFAAIPYQESQYRADATSPVCARGYWQLMPETAHRMEVTVAECKLRGSEEPWSPTSVVTLPRVRNAAYIEMQGETPTCRIQSCRVDERRDLTLSTRAAVELLKEAFEDETLAGSGAAVQLAILSHNAGYDDGRYLEGHHKPLNVRPAYLRYLAKAGVEAAPDVYGKNILCGGVPDGTLTCGGVLHRETQHYAYNIVAQHLLAVCYYATEYGSIPAFQPWRDYVRGDGYCNAIQVPSKEKLAKKEGK